LSFIQRYNTYISSVFVLLVLAMGWLEREEYWLTAESGWGYALGIIGGSLMLLLMLYPLRKHWKFARNWFGIRHWFKLHMIFGVIGPVLILFHSNFQLGSMNSNIALFSMILVSSSGVVGRYAYQKIHRGLYGKQIEFSELQKAFESSREYLTKSAILEQEIHDKLTTIEQQVTKRNIGFFAAFGCYQQTAIIQKRLRKNLKRRANLLLSDRSKFKVFMGEAKLLLTGVARLKSMASYALFAKTFSMWHLFHLPLFFLMILAAVVHIFAVHMY